MSELCEALFVVFTSSPEIEDHLFAKSIRWADQNPDDTVIWLRRKPLEKIPDLDIDWSSKIGALRRVQFEYKKNKIIAGCFDEAVESAMSSDIAALICSLTNFISCSQMGSLLAALVNFCQACDGRAVVVIDHREQEKQEDEESSSGDMDPFENSEFLEDEEKLVKKTEKHRILGEMKDDKDEHLRKLRRVSSIYTRNVFDYVGGEFLKCL